MKHIVMFSGGVGSWMAANRVKKQYGQEDIILLFTDTLIEDKGLYRFLIEASINIGAPLVWIKDGRTPWALFFEEGMMGNTRADMCSRILKRELADRWVQARYKPDDCIIYAGFDCMEVNRFEGMAKRLKPYICKAPMTEPPYLSKNQMFDELKKEGIALPDLYKMGFPHNNCGGFCVKGGHAHFKLLYREKPHLYKLYENLEEKFRNHTGSAVVTPIVSPYKDVAILRDRRRGPRDEMTGQYTKPYTLKQLREEKLEGPGKIDEFDFGGCGCFAD